jgi:hypothetical protein
MTVVFLFPNASLVRGFMKLTPWALCLRAQFVMTLGPVVVSMAWIGDLTVDFMDHAGSTAK